MTLVTSGIALIGFYIVSSLLLCFIGLASLQGLFEIFKYTTLCRVIDFLLETYCVPMIWILERILGDEKAPPNSDEQERIKTASCKQENGARSPS